MAEIWQKTKTVKSANHPNCVSGIFHGITLIIGMKWEGDIAKKKREENQ